MANGASQQGPSTQDLITNIENLHERLGHLEETENVLRQTEQRVNEYEEENAALRRQLADITNLSQAQASTHRRARGAEDGPSDNEDEAPAAKRTHAAANIEDNAPNASLAEDAVQAGRKYAMTGMPWLLQRPSADFFKIPRDPDFDKSKRHDSDSGRIQGQLHEIYDMLPERLRPYFTHKWFANRFHSGMRTQISNTAHRIRSDGAFILFPNEAGHMESSATRYEHFKARLGHQHAANGKPEYFPTLDCPLLHENPGPNGKYNLKEAFKPYMFKVIHVLILRGKESARAAQLHIGKIVKPQSEYMQEKHRITFTTPGAAALCFILGRWLISPDVKLLPIGSESGIDYAADFNDYLKILQHGLDERSPTIRALFRDWDRLVFGLKRSRYGGTGALPQEIRREEVTAALAAFDDEEPEASSEEEETEQIRGGSGGE